MSLFKKSKMDSAEPKGKSLAISYAMKKKSKKMAEGGEVDDGKHRNDNEKGVHKASSYHDPDGGVSAMGESVRRGMYGIAKVGSKRRLAENKYIHADPKLKGLAEGGEVEGDHIDRILAKCMAEGGEVADEMPNDFDYMDLHDAPSFSYDAANSGDEHGSKLNQEEDRFDRMLKKRSK